MNYIGKFISNFKEAYNEINAATLTGAIDVVVVQQPDGSFTSSPFHVRFGKIGVLRSREKVVDIEINGDPIDIHMKLGENGEAFFVQRLEDGEELEEDPFLGTSPLPSFILNYPPGHNHPEDDVKSQDSGVGAEEIISKSLKVKQQSQSSQKSKEKSQGISPQVLATSLSKIEKSSTTSVAPNSTPVKFMTGHEAEELENNSTTETRECSAEPSNSLDIETHSPGESDHLARRSKNSSKERHSLRSKSLTNELFFLNAKDLILDGQGFRTDGEDGVKVKKYNRRRKRKRVNNSKRRRQNLDSHSSDASSSCTPETPTCSQEHNEPIFVMDDLDGYNQHKKLEVKRLRNQGSIFERPETSRSGRASVSIHPDFHPFSDTDLSPPPSPKKYRSRSNTPVKSDTEYEFEKQKTGRKGTTEEEFKHDKWSWTWGQLPTPPVGQRSLPASRQSFVDSVNTAEDPEATNSQSQVDEATQRSMLSNMFSFMKATKKARHNPLSEGIYLDDLNLDELEPEVAALYFPRNSKILEKQNSTFTSVKDDDVESGNGASLPHSPHSVEGAIGGPKFAPIDPDFDDSSHRHPIFDFRNYDDIAFSLCGKLHEHIDSPFPEALFMQNIVTFDDLCENPCVMDNPDLVVRLGGHFYNWGTAAPLIMSLVLFQLPLPKKVRDRIEAENMPKKEIRKRTQSKGYSWFPWGRSPDSTDPNQSKSSNETSAPLENTSNSQPPTGDDNHISDQSTMLHKTEASKKSTSIMSSPHLPSTSATTMAATSATNTTTTTTDHATSVSPEQVSSFQEGGSEVVTTKNHWDSFDDFGSSDKYVRWKKTIRLSSDQIGQLNLKAGINEVVFSVTTAYQGTTRCKCHIFLWRYDEKIIISDIDGTITKSDVLGHILPIIGKDWAQGGVAQLYTKIKNNGYNFLYLSSRAIGQARITRDFLRSVRQGDISLPDGPLLLNPTSLIQAFHREVIEKKPEEFKISCLKDIKALFPPEENPFYAGYGNRVNDVWAYSAVGVPIHRIFTINYKGELKHELTQAFQTTYFCLSDIVNHMFPSANNRELLNEYTTLRFWKDPMPDFTAEIDEVFKSASTTTK